MEREQPKDYIFSAQERKTVRDFVEEAFRVAGIMGVWWNSGSDFFPESFILADERGLATKKLVTLVQVNKNLCRKEESLPVVGNICEARSDFGWSNTTSFKDLVKKMVSHDLQELDKSS
jgi:GDPmannose 4,6-dehydratase